MPPRLGSLLGASLSVPPPAYFICSFLLPGLQSQQRGASILSCLSDNAGAYNKKIRRGRGPASGKGKTSGRGHKGQKQHGKVPRGFNGGQTPLEVVHGKRGFVNVFSVDMQPVNIDRIQAWIDQGRIDPSRPITLKELGESRCVTNIKDGVKLLAKGSEQLRTPLNVVVSQASAAAISAIEAAGGSVTTRYFTPFSIQRILRGRTDPINSLRSHDTDADSILRGGFQQRLPDPTSRKDIEYYRDPAHRGYLSHLVPEGQGPSLFFKTPTTGMPARRKASSAKAVAAENRMW
ncbi:50s ribosomal subunit protein l15 [Lasallia pustulata]|uniref:50s ribosomal subunit protein l15 n=1 Tax=Lasallia pustulata TaxID=136370 RepID=A0A1W5DED3_9LECA|nr:50s ribosomal subunit protein l15 [Lasallia pustulata]